jgi:hypothetical protein
MNVPKIVSMKVTITSATFHDAQHRAPLLERSPSAGRPSP